ncbi:MAG TPA: serine hydrolase domain-containing protein [Candidatus Krumholzibacteria bacterium]|nr:serine hydrolase domain-containing protein [Candidatus Krumholzibacteria bacterium]
MRMYSAASARPWILLITLIAACSPARAAAPDSLATAWSSAMQELHIPGMMVVVVNRDGIVRRDLLGVRDTDRSLPVDLDTRMYIASCTKPFVACAVTLLANDGRIDLDAPVRRYLPRFTLATPGYADSITVRDLLGHRPGLVNKTITFGDAYTGEMTDGRYYRLLSETTPRRSFAYSNLHYTLLGRVIQSVTGKPWQEVVTERVFVPAGMTRTTCAASAAWADANVARPYEYEQGHLVLATPLKSDATMHAAGGIFTTGNDLARWLRLQLGDGMLDGRRVLPAAALRSMRTLLASEAAGPHPLLKWERRIAWSAGWDVRTFDADTLYCHNGNYSGSGAFLAFLPGRNLGVAVAANGPGSVFLAEVAAAQALDAALPRSHPNMMPALLDMVRARAARNAEATSATGGALSLPAARYAGDFYNDDCGTLNVVVKGDSLSATIGALSLGVDLTGRDRFIADGYPGRFEVGAEGRIDAVWLCIAPPDSVRFERRQ